MLAVATNVRVTIECAEKVINVSYVSPEKIDITRNGTSNLVVEFHRLSNGIERSLFVRLLDTNDPSPIKNIWITSDQGAGSKYETNVVRPEIQFLQILIFSIILLVLLNILVNFLSNARFLSKKR